MNFSERPKLKLRKSWFELMFDGLTLILFIVNLVYLIAVWSSLPAEVPAHYNAAGEVDRWGSKWELVIDPLIASTMWISMTVLEKYPHVYNYPRLTKENVRAQYRNARQMLNVVKNILTLIFAYITWKDLQVSLGHAEAIGPLFVPFFFIILFGPMIFFIIRAFRL